MVRLEFTGSVKEIHDEMLAMLGRSDETVTVYGLAADEPAPPKVTRTRKAKADEGNAAGTEPAASADTPTASDSSPASSAEAESPSSAGATKTADGGGGNAITRATVEPKCMAYGQKGGMQALKELFIEMGSPAGKWTAVPDDKLPALDARLDELLAG